jgi:hypothetical protein
LNCHREDFCNKLKELKGIKIDPENISKIPVHECNKLGVKLSQADEHAVFNDPSYWTSMKAMDNASDMLKRLKNMFGFKIYIFTWRPWPNRATITEDEEEKIDILWDQCTSFLG